MSVSARAVQYNSFGSFDKLETVSINLPAPGSKQIIVKTKTAAINPLDWKVLSGENFTFRLIGGTTFPKRIGCEFSGIVEKVGSGVQGLKVGDEVFGTVDPFKNGSMADMILVDAESVIKKPAEISFAQASTLSIVGAAALESIKVGNIHKGTKLLINGASGGVGMILIQLAKQHGAIITGTCSERNISKVKSWGCDNVVDYTKEDITKSGNKYDVIFDLSSKWTYQTVAPIMEYRSILLNSTPEIGDIISSPFRNLFSRHKWLNVLSSPTQPVLTELSAQASKGMIIEVGKKFSFDNVVDAYNCAKEGKNGKIVVEF